MKNLILLTIFTFLFTVTINAHQAFTLVSSKTKTVAEKDLSKIEKAQTVGKKDNSTLTFTDNEIKIVVTTGPEDDMLSFRIQGMRNPTLVVPPDATITILFINTDEDMKHDIRFGHVVKDFAVTPILTNTVGTIRLDHKPEGKTLNAQEIVIKPTMDGAYKYFCSVNGHAKGGMWGNILVGVEPGDNMKMPEKMNMDMNDKKSDEMPGMKMDDKKKPEDMSKIITNNKQTETRNI